jgi:hypothetical protein
MKQRRNFMKMAAAAIPALAAARGTATAADNNVKDFLGAWTTLHTSPFGPFREFLTFAEGGALTETNALLHMRSNLAYFAAFGLPNAVNASDGMGTWRRTGPGEIEVAFRKLLFDGAGQYFGDFLAKGTFTLRGRSLRANWHQIWIVDDSNLPQPRANLGTATSTGVRIE